jgi:(heptosyl)LPS beta-1,4-glucosyltransferase
MSVREKLSVTIIAGEAENEIRDCLESVKWADEIVVIDSQSRDKTVEIAREYTENIHVKRWEGYSAQKQFALDQAVNEWVLSLDTDERVTEGLRREIEAILAGDASLDGYFIPRRNYFLGRWIRYCGWYPGYQMRLFRKRKARVHERKVHERFVVEGRVGYLKNDLIHRTHPTIDDTLAKINEYSTLNAEERAAEKKISALDLAFRPAAAFLQFYVLKQGFRDGVHGLMVSMIHAMTKAETYLKAWELQNVSRTS